jgi:hypothetical protein
MANPQDDYKTWLVINPGKWLPVIWIVALLVACHIHYVVLNSAKYNFVAMKAAADLIVKK